LAPYAGSGIPTREKLTASFPGLADDALRATLLPPGDGFWRRVLARLSTIVSIRRIDGKGTDTAALLGRAEQDVRLGDLEAAIGELAGLSGPAAETTAQWQHDATARNTADRALSRLTALTAAESAKSGK
jgi:uroporphyrinogen-III synthase